MKMTRYSSSIDNTNFPIVGQHWCKSTKVTSRRQDEQSLGGLEEKWPSKVIKTCNEFNHGHVILF